MPAVWVWAVESVFDRDAVESLAEKLVDYSGRKIEIRKAGKKTYNRVAKRLRKNPDALKVAVRAYLADSDSLIFVIDRDSPVARGQTPGTIFYGQSNRKGRGIQGI